MSVTPDILARTLAGSHQVVFDARICTTYQDGIDPDGEPIEVLGGSVTMDASAEIGRTLRLSTTGISQTGGESLWPRRGSDLRAPYKGHDIFVRRGVSLGPAKAPFMVPLGYFRIEDTEQDDAADGEILLQGMDRMAHIIDAVPTLPRTFKADRTVQSVIEEIVLEIYPAAAIFIDEPAVAADTIGRQIVMDDTRHGVLLELAEMYGKVIDWNGIGVFRFRDAPAEDSIAWTAGTGRAGTLTGAKRRMTRRGVKNGWVVTGEGAGPLRASRGVAVDRGPHSPTRWGAIEDGAFGRVPGFDSSPLVKNSAQAATAAREKLRRTIGTPYSIDWGSVPNPILEPYDRVTVVLSDYTHETHVIDRLVMPLDETSEMAGTTRDQSLVVIGAPV